MYIWSLASAQFIAKWQEKCHFFRVAYELSQKILINKNVWKNSLLENLLSKD